MQKITIILEWVRNHWVELTAALGFGTGGVYTGKSMIDKKQDKKIGEIDKRVQVLENGQMDLRTGQLELKKDIEHNTKEDDRFRDDFKEFKKETKDELNSIKQDQKDGFAETRGDIKAAMEQIWDIVKSK